MSRRPRRSVGSSSGQRHPVAFDGSLEDHEAGRAECTGDVGLAVHEDPGSQDHATRSQLAPGCERLPSPRRAVARPLAFTALRLVGESLSDSEKFNELRQTPFFEGFGDVALWEVVRVGSWKKIPAGSVIIREGDHGDSFYLLIAGEVSVTLSGTQLNTIKPGGCFGEILYFTDRVERRTTTITTDTEVTVIEIKAATLRAATDACQVGFNKAFMRVLIERLMQANMRLAARG